MTLIWASHKLFEHLQVRRTDSTRQTNWIATRLPDSSWSNHRSYNYTWNRRLHGEYLRMETS